MKVKKIYIGTDRTSEFIIYDKGNLVASKRFFSIPTRNVKRAKKATDLVSNTKPSDNIVMEITDESINITIGSIPDDGHMIVGNQLYKLLENPVIRDLSEYINIFKPTNIILKQNLKAFALTSPESFILSIVTTDPTKDQIPKSKYLIFSYTKDGPYNALVPPLEMLGELPNTYFPISKTWVGMKTYGPYALSSKMVIIYPELSKVMKSFGASNGVYALVYEENGDGSVKCYLKQIAVKC